MSVLTLQGQAKIQGSILFNPLAFWDFSTPSSGTTITNFSVITNDASSVIVNWGDGTTSTANSNSPVSKTY